MAGLVGFVKNWWHYAIGFAILVYLLSRLDVSAIASAFSSANAVLVVVAFLLIVPMFIIKAVRWQYIMGRQGIRYGLGDSISMYFAAMYIGFVTPGRVAELLKASYLVRDGHSFGKSFFSVFLDRLVDLLFLMIIGYFGLFFFKNLFSTQIVWLGLLGVAGAVAAFVLLVKKELAKSLLKSLLKRVVPASRKASVEAYVEDFYASMGLFNLKSSAVILLLTALSFVFYFLVAVLLARSLGINVNYVFIIFSMSIAALIAILPVSIAGVGTRDATLLLLLGSLGVAKETIIAYSTFNLLATLFLIGLCSQFWFRKPIRF